MDPCPFVRLMVESLAIKLPSASGWGVPCYAKLKLNNFPSQTALLSSTSAPGFSHHLHPDTLRSLHSVITLKISVFTGPKGRTCGIACGRLLGSVQVCVNLAHAQTKPCLYQNGWMKLSGSSEPVARLYMTVRSEPDPRFVFQFGGEPECSPVVFQIQGNLRQPVFSCKFNAERSNGRSRSLPCDSNGNNRRWLRTFSGREKDRAGKERKGWMFIVYDLSGSAVAAASMTTPFVPSPGFDHVSRSNPGAWLILRPTGVSISSWKPWGRLEAWRERGPLDGLGYKFELMTNTGLIGGIPIAQGTMSVNKGGKFRIDSSGKDSALSHVHGFVMESSVEGEGRVSKPAVQVGVQHVTCMADAALFVALSAAVDLSMDACQLFSHKLRKELSNEGSDLMFP